MAPRPVGTRFSDVSKAVGWESDAVPWPLIDMVGDAIARRDCESLLRWNRFLPVASTSEQTEIIKVIVDGLRKVRGEME